MACGCNNSYYNLPCCCPPAVVGTTTTSTTTMCPDAIICEEAYKSDCIIYNGPDLDCYGIRTGASVTEIINIIIAQLDPCTTTTTSTTTLCVRPTGLTTLNLNTTLNGVPFSGSLAEACDAYNQFAANPGLSLSGITGQASSATIGQVVYNGVGTDCTLAQNGYYIIDSLAGVYQISNGILASVDLCTTTTSTTSTSTTTTTTANPFAPFVCECISYTLTNNSGSDTVVPFTDCITGLPDPDGITVLGDPLNNTAEVCACIDSIPTLPDIVATPNGPCAIPTTTSTTTVEPTTTSTTTVEPTTTSTTTLEPTTTSTTTTSSTTTTTTADPSVTTTTSTTTTANPDFTTIAILNNDLSYGMEILAIYDLGTGLIIPLDSGTYPISSGVERTITLPNGLYDFDVYVSPYDNRGSVTLVDSNGTADCRSTDIPGNYVYTGVFLDDFGGTSPSSITLLDALC